MSCEQSSWDEKEVVGNFKSVLLQCIIDCFHQLHRTVQDTYSWTWSTWGLHNFQYMNVLFYDSSIIFDCCQCSLVYSHVKIVEYVLDNWARSTCSHISSCLGKSHASSVWKFLYIVDYTTWQEYYCDSYKLSIHNMGVQAVLYLVNLYAWLYTFAFYKLSCIGLAAEILLVHGLMFTVQVSSCM